MPGIVIGIAEMAGWGHLVDAWWTDGRVLLGMMVLCVQAGFEILRKARQNEEMNDKISTSS